MNNIHNPRFSLCDAGFTLILFVMGIVASFIVSFIDVSSDFRQFLTYFSLLFFTVFYIVMGDLYDKKINDNNYRFLNTRNWFGFFPIFDTLFVLPYRHLNNKNLTPIRSSGKYREISSSISLILAIIVLSDNDLSYWLILAKNIIVNEGVIVGLILVFALLSYGLKRSKYFDYIAYRLIERCGGSTSKLIIYMFIITSVLTLFTSNDVVILVLTPIILRMLRLAKIRNARLILLSQFVAANTVSMAFIFGSPTNLFYGMGKFTNGNTFVEYMLLMAIPTIIVFMITMITIDWINGRDFKYWKFDKFYESPGLSEKIPYDNKKMTPWIFSVGIAIVSLVFTTSNDGSQEIINPVIFSLLIGILGYVFVTYLTTPKDTSPKEIFKKDILTSQGVPWQIVFFALSFFMVGHEIAIKTNNLDFVTNFILLFDNQYWYIFSSILSSVFTVNIVNDLPAAVMLSNLSFTILDTRLIDIGILIGLNIGTYLTPIGALAGMMWFHELSKKEPGDFELKIPTRQGLFKYGLIIITAAITSVTLILPELLNIYDWLTGVSDSFFVNGVGITISVLIFVFIINYIYNNVLKKHIIAITELNAILGLQDIIYRYTHNNIVKTYIFVLIIVLLALLLPVWAIEYSLNPGLDISKFLIGIPGMIGVGMDVDTAVIKLISPYGKMIMGILPIISIGLVMWIMSSIKQSSDVRAIRESICKNALGDHKVFFIGDLHSVSNNLVKKAYSSVTHSKDLFFTFLINKNEINGVLENLVYDKIYNNFIDHYSDASDMVMNYKLERAQEIFLLSGRDKALKLANNMKVANATNLRNQTQTVKLFYISDEKNQQIEKTSNITLYPCDEKIIIDLLSHLYNHRDEDIINYQGYSEREIKSFFNTPPIINDNSKLIKEILSARTKTNALKIINQLRNDIK